MTEASIPHEMIKGIKTSMNEIRTRRRANTPAVESFADEWIAKRDKLEDQWQEGGALSPTPAPLQDREPQ